MRNPFPLPPRAYSGRTGGPLRSLLTVSEVWGETGWKSFSGDCVPPPEEPPCDPPPELPPRDPPPEGRAAVSAAAGRAWRWPAGIGPAARLPATISSVTTATRRARHWSARIGASAARRYDRLLHIECWPAGSAAVVASARVIFILPRRRGRLRIVTIATAVRSAHSNVLPPFDCPCWPEGGVKVRHPGLED